MEVDLDTFLVTGYCLVDDLYRDHCAAAKPVRPGPQPALADSEVLTLVLLAQWQQDRSERAFLRYAARHWRRYFPRLLDQSAFNRRARDLAGVLIHLMPHLAACAAAEASYHIFAGLPVPLMRICRGKRHRLFADEAAVGKGGSDHAWYYGCQLLLTVTDAGLITGFLLAPASTEGHWLAEALLCWRAAPTAAPWTPADLPPSHNRGGHVGPTSLLWPRAGVGPWTAGPYVADGGFRGPHWAQHWRQDYGAIVWTPASYQGAQAAAARR